MIKKLLKIFLFIFSYIFTIKIFFKNKLLWPWFTKGKKHKTKQKQKRKHKEATNIQNKIEEGQI